MSSEKRPHILNLDAARRQCGPASEKEVAARAAIEARAGRPLNDLEWARARARLLDFVAAAPSPPGSSRRAGGYSPVLRLTADEMSLPLFPCPKKFTFWDTTLLPRGTFWVRVPRRPARGRPKAVFLLLACCTQEEDAGPAGTGKDPPARLLLPGGLTQEAALVAVCVGCWPLRSEEHT